MKNDLMFSAAIFDLDGTLIDSNPVWEKLDRIILSERGLDCTDEFISALAAMTYEDAAAAICGMGVKISPEELKKELDGLAAYEYANNIPMKDGVYEYLSFLKGKNVKTVLATASPPLFYEPALRRLKIYGFFDFFLTTEEIGKSKEHPDIYILAAGLTKTLPESCIVFEDALNALKSASSAGMKTVGVYDRYSEKNGPDIKKLTNKYIYSFKEML